MDPWSKGDCSRHIREAIMVVEKTPKVNPPSGRVIRPKCIYNFCLLHACFVWLCHVFLELSYTFKPSWTNLLTQCTQLPVVVFCCFCISGFSAIKSAPKNPENQIKNQCPGSFLKNQEREGGPPPASQEGSWRGPTLCRARDPPD